MRDDGILDEYSRWIFSNSSINEWTLYFEGWKGYIVFPSS